MTTFAFDVYGTLIDTNGITSKLTPLLGERAKDIALTWREKQLEYSFRCGLMRQYQSFALCTRQALDYACSYYEGDLSVEQKDQLLKSYDTLPVFGDVKEALTKLQMEGHRLFAFSNGAAQNVETLLQHACIRELFEAVISVDDIKTFKPNPDCYHYFLQRANVEAAQAQLVSSNPFDVIGASSVGMQTTWVRRSDKSLFDPWGIEPSRVVSSLSELCMK